MPRGRKPGPKTYEGKLELLNTKIEEHEQAVKELLEKRALLVTQKEEEDLSRLLRKIKESGKTVDEFILSIHANKE